MVAARNGPQEREERADDSRVDLTAEVRLQRVREWQRGEERGGRRPSLPGPEALRWFLDDHRYGLDAAGRVTVIAYGRVCVVPRKQVAREWSVWSATHAWREMRVPTCAGTPSPGISGFEA